MLGRKLRYAVAIAGVLATVILSVVIVSDAQITRSIGRRGRRVLTEDRSATVSICHSTGSNTNPYEITTVSTNGNAHLNHPEDLIPAPVAGCPGAAPQPSPTPEPVTMLLFGSGLVGVGYLTRRRAKANR